jgi:hypothetical protein
MRSFSGCFTAAVGGRIGTPSENQEAVLEAAEKLGWPPWFDDPLPALRGGNPKRRLRETINDLNRRQRKPFVHFTSDGSGRRIGWELR